MDLKIRKIFYELINSSENEKKIRIKFCNKNCGYEKKVATKKILYITSRNIKIEFTFEASENKM